MTVQDVLVIGVVLFFCAIGGVVAYYGMHQVMEKFVTAGPIANEPLAVEGVRAFENNVQSKTDYGFLVIFFGLMLASMITAWFVAGNTLFTWIFGLIYCIFMAFTPLLSNVFAAMTSTYPLSTAMVAFPIMNHIMLNLPLYVALDGMLLLIIMFVKPTLDQGVLR